MSRVIRLAKKSVEIVKNDGIVGFTKRGAKYAYYRKFPNRRKTSFKDILFINGSGSRLSGSLKIRKEANNA